MAENVGAAGASTNLSLNFSSTTADYNVKIDGKAFTVTGASLANGTAAAALITAINATAIDTMNTTALMGSTINAANGGGKPAAGGLSSLGNTIAAVTSTATVVNYEIVQNGSTLTIKKAAGTASRYRCKSNRYSCISGQFFHQLS